MEINRDGELRDIVLNLILKRPLKRILIKKEDNARPTIFLIDEVDVFFSKAFFGEIYPP